MRAAISVFVGLVLSACATAAPEPQVSWGKPGIAYLQYWTDAAECTLAGAQAGVTMQVGNLDINRRAEAPVLPEINRQPSIEESVGGVNDMILRQRHNDIQRRRYDDAQRRVVIDDCLRARGYRQFQLTATQADALSALEPGSNERRRYLHGLASDAAVLNGQGV